MLEFVNPVTSILLNQKMEVKKEFSIFKRLAERRAQRAQRARSKNKKQADKFLKIARKLKVNQGKVI